LQPTSPIAPHHNDVILSEEAALFSSRPRPRGRAASQSKNPSSRVAFLVIAAAHAKFVIVRMKTLAALKHRTNDSQGAAQSANVNKNHKLQYDDQPAPEGRHN
jgi:hypothetical protein